MHAIIFLSTISGTKLMICVVICYQSIWRHRRKHLSKNSFYHFTKQAHPKSNVTVLQHSFFISTSNFKLSPYHKFTLKWCLAGALFRPAFRWGWSIFKDASMGNFFDPYRVLCIRLEVFSKTGQNRTNGVHSISKIEIWRLILSFCSSISLYPAQRHQTIADTGISVIKEKTFYQV